MNLPKPLRYILGWSGMLFYAAWGLLVGAVIGMHRSYTEMLSWMKTGRR